MNHRGHRENRLDGGYLYLRLLCVLCGKFMVCVWAVILLVAPIAAQDRKTTTRDKRLRYDLKLEINFDDRTYTGTEQVHWVNHGDRATSTIFFHLYPNMRTPDYV